MHTTNHGFNDPNFVPDELIIRCDVDIKIDFNDETALGEPVAWVYFSDNTSLEICHEESGLETPYFSVRLHCSEEDFENDIYHKTCGVISSEVCNNFNAVIKTITDIANKKHRKNIKPVNI